MTMPTWHLKEEQKEEQREREERVRAREWQRKVGEKMGERKNISCNYDDKLSFIGGMVEDDIG